MHHECIMQRHYQDIAPEPPAVLPPPSLQVVSECTQMEPDLPPSWSPPNRCPTHALLVRRILKSPHNTFGLFWQYYATRFPDHDPGENITYNDLIDAPPDPSFTSLVTTTTHIRINRHFCWGNGTGTMVKGNYGRASRIFSR